MRRSGFLGLFLGAGLLITGCSAPPLPEVTFFSDGHTARTEPLQHCDALLRQCEQTAGAAAVLKVRPGKSVQISVPSEIAETPWLVNVEYVNAAGETQPIIQKTFTSTKQFAFTAQPPTAGDQLVVVEVQQLGAIRLLDAANKPAFDDAGQPQYEVRARAVWSLQIQPA